MYSTIVSTKGAQSGQSIWWEKCCKGLKMTNFYSKHVALLKNKIDCVDIYCVTLIEEVIGQVLNCVPIKLYYYFQLRSSVRTEFNSLNITEFTCSNH